jgi:hypothetical protein
MSTTQKVLDALPLDGKCLTTAKIAAIAGLDRKRVASRCYQLAARGLAVADHPGCWRLTEQGRVARETGAKIKPGPMGPHNHRRPKKVRPNVRTRTWTALRSLTKATIPDLAQLAKRGDEKAAEDNIRKYITALKSAGYVTVLPRRQAGVLQGSNGYLVYLLVKDTGPRAPVLRARSRRLYDPNTDSEIALTVEDQP